MADVSKTRAGLSAWTITGAAILAAVFSVGGAEASWAQPSAPIIYAKPLSPSSSPTARFENRADSATIVVDPSAPVPTLSGKPSVYGEFDAGTAIDLRPGSTRVSFGPAVPTSTSRVNAARPLISAPLPQVTAPAGSATPVAGPPYQVDGKWYVPTYEPNYDEVGTASWYGPTFHGKPSASGEVFDEYALTAAHPTLPIPSLVRVTNLENNRTIVVRLNDRGPFVDDRIIDLSRAAGLALDMQGKGTAKVRVQYVGPAPESANALPAQAPTNGPLNVVAQTLPPLAPVSAPVVRPVDQRGFFLQAGSFADLANANALRDRLRSEAPVSILAVTVNGTEFYRVMLGPWTSRVEAEDAQERLDQAGAKTLVVARAN